MSDPQQRNATCAAAYYYMLLSYQFLTAKKGKPKRWWTRALYKSRDRHNMTDMLGDLSRQPSGHFENFCKMSATDFEYFVTKLGLVISKTDTTMRYSIPVKERLAVTLRFLATGDSFKRMSFLFKFSPQSVSICVEEVCEALIAELKEEIRLPENPNEWRKIAEDFKRKWNFPHCVGAIDGKHIVMQSPCRSGSEFYNYKGTFSFLMAVVNANYEFMYVDIGCQGRISDGGVFNNTSFFRKMDANQLMMPVDELIPPCERPLPYVFVADDAFGLTRHLLKGYPGIYDKATNQRIFNYRLSRARRVVENVFGIMTSVFRVFRKPLLLQPRRVAQVTMTCVLLHNFLHRSATSSSIYVLHHLVDAELNGELVPGTWRSDGQSTNSFVSLQTVHNNPPLNAKSVRDHYAQYFNTHGAVAWQHSI